MRDYENDYKAFNDATIDFFYDDYFKGEEGHDYTDEQIQMSVNKDDIENCLDTMRGILYDHFGINKAYTLALKENLLGYVGEIQDEHTGEERLKQCYEYADELIGKLAKTNPEYKTMSYSQIYDALTKELVD